LPDFLIGPGIAIARWVRQAHQARRRVKLTVHRAVWENVYGLIGDEIISAERDEYFITITNASRDRDIVVTHVWIESDPPVPVLDPDLPVRLQYHAPWETSVLAEDVPAPPEEVPWLARCQLSPDDKVIKSRPRRNVPPVGTVPRG
jgi:hypothetical protein